MHFNEGMKKHVSTQTFPFPPFLVLSNSFASIFHFIHVDALSVDDAKAIFRVDYRSTGIKSRPQKVEQMVLNFNVISVFHTFRTLDRIWMHCMITWALYTPVRTAFSIRYVNWTLFICFQGMRAPSFRCTEEPDGSLILHYYSERAGLEHIVIGIVKVEKKKSNRKQRWQMSTD